MHTKGYEDDVLAMTVHLTDMLERHKQKYRDSGIDIHKHRYIYCREDVRKSDLVLWIDTIDKIITLSSAASDDYKIQINELRNVFRYWLEWNKKTALLPDDSFVTPAGWPTIEVVENWISVLKGNTVS